MVWVCALSMIGRNHDAGTIGIVVEYSAHSVTFHFHVTKEKRQGSRRSQLVLSVEDSLREQQHFEV